MGHDNDTAGEVYAEPTYDDPPVVEYSEEYSEDQAERQLNDILIADDEESVVTVMTHLLQKHGYYVRACHLGADVLDEIARQEPDLLILDVQMPDMSGFDVLNFIRRDHQHHNLPVIFVSGMTDEESITNGMSIGADDYLVKPVCAGELLAKIKLVFKKRELKRLTAMGFVYGSLFDSRYRIECTLGTGGYGTVYMARDTQQPEEPPVALKAFNHEHSIEDGFISFFLREAYAHSKLSHPNIVDLHDFGQHDGIYFMVMEYVDGLDLEDILYQNGLLQEDEAITLTYEMAKVLHYLEKNDLVHRDIKPRNIMISATGQTKLLDFGMARPIKEQTLSFSNVMGGTPHFLSPEYISDSQHVDIRADIYSLGMTIYFALTGRYPFQDASDMEVIQHHLADERTSIAEYRPELDPNFINLLDAMVSRNIVTRPTPENMIGYIVEAFM